MGGRKEVGRGEEMKGRKGEKGGGGEEEKEEKDEKERGGKGGRRGRKKEGKGGERRGKRGRRRMKRGEYWRMETRRILSPKWGGLTGYTRVHSPRTTTSFTPLYCIVLRRVGRMGMGSKHR